jgi:hypothetical protein
MLNHISGFRFEQIQCCGRADPTRCAETATAVRRRELAEHVERVFDASRGT